ncbi:MAG TPA: chromate efflux transporter [Methylomirabilota bacterium]|nr:chromate efflux transporter [Methylomirabilota bacterium]
MSEPRTTWSLIRYFLYLGSLGFGGPAALVGYMQRDLVESRAWFTKDEYVKGLALSQLAPGPLAAQLAICLGYSHGRIWGATLVGVAFIVPSFLMTVALGALYVGYGGLSWMQAVFYGVGAAVIGIIVRSAWRLAKLTMARDRLLWGVFAIMAVVTAWTESEMAALFILSGIVIMLIKAPPRRLLALVGSSKSLLSAAWPALLLTGLGSPATSGILAQILWFFTKAGAFVFGSGLAIVPFLYGGVVQEHQWLNDKQFLDAVAVAMITPGPVVITVAFIGYLVAGLGGAIAAGIGVFLPVYLFVIVLYPFFDRWSRIAQVKAFVMGVTAAAAGAIAGACFVLGRRAIFDVPTAALAVAVFLLLWRFKVPEPILIIAAGLVGLSVFWLRGAL